MSEKEINIYFKNDDVKNEVLKGSSNYEKYIILMNETLQAENKDLTLKIKKLEHENDQQEEDIDKFDVSKRYMISLLKNLVELEKFRDTIGKNRSEINSDITNILDRYRAKGQKHIYYLESLLVIIMSILFEIKFFNEYQFGLVSFLILFTIAFLQNMLNNLIIPKYIEKYDTINEIEGKIDAIKKTQDFLNEYIECL